MVWCIEGNYFVMRFFDKSHVKESGLGFIMFSLAKGCKWIKDLIFPDFPGFTLVLVLFIKVFLVLNFLISLDGKWLLEIWKAIFRIPRVWEEVCSIFLLLFLKMVYHSSLLCSSYSFQNSGFERPTTFTLQEDIPRKVNI